MTTNDPLAVEIEELKAAKDDIVRRVEALERWMRRLETQREVRRLVQNEGEPKSK